MCAHKAREDRDDDTEAACVRERQQLHSCVCVRACVRVYTTRTRTLHTRHFCVCVCVYIYIRMYIYDFDKSPVHPIRALSRLTEYGVRVPVSSTMALTTASIVGGCAARGLTALAWKPFAALTINEINIIDHQ